MKKTPAGPAPIPKLTPAQLLVFFLKLLPGRALLRLPALQGQRFYHRLFSPAVTLWYLVFQRLNFDHSLEAALVDAQAGGGKALNRQLARKLVSSSTASYSDARQRLPREFLAEALRLQGRKITALGSSSALWKGFGLTLLDGSTIRLRPHRQLAREFPPQRNQHRAAYWCLMRVVVSFCAFTGAALDCALNRTGVGEQTLGCEVILRTLSRSLFIGDRNFGVFRIVQAARQNQQSLLVRLTAQRARKLLGRSLRLGDHQVNWQPSRQDQLDPAFSQAPVAGRLLIAEIKRRGFRSQRICLFTTLTDPLEYPLAELVRLYGLRWQIELNLKHVKTEMATTQLEVYSAEMARKEWLATLLAYNLIRAAMLCAALKKGISPLTLSFSAARRRLELWLGEFGRRGAKAYGSWLSLLDQIGKCSLPRRRKPRPSEPRAQRHLRQPYPPLLGSRAQARRKLHQHRAKS
jgi:hypothetical protein